MHSAIVGSQIGLVIWLKDLCKFGSKILTLNCKNVSDYGYLIFIFMILCITCMKIIV